MDDPSDVAVHPTCLIDISTSTHATKEVDDSLFTAVDEGGHIYAFFVDQSGSFYNPIPL